LGSADPRILSDRKSSSPQPCLSQRQASEHITSPSSRSSQQVPSAGSNVLDASCCSNSTANGPASPSRRHDGNTNWQESLRLPQFDSDIPWALSGLAMHDSDWFPLGRRIERVQAASHFLEGWSFNFNYLSNGHEPSHMSAPDIGMAWEVWTVGIGSQFSLVQTPWMTHS
jgi:hypothetical protein